MNSLTVETASLPNQPAKKMNLFQVGQEGDAFKALLHEYLVENEGDISDEQTSAIIESWLAETSLSLNAKIDGYVSVIRQRAALAKQRRGFAAPYLEEAKSYTDLAKVDEALSDRLKARLLDFFHEQGMDGHETEHYKLTVAGNGGLRPLIILPATSPDEVAERYTSKSFNTSFIRETLEIYEENMARYEAALNAGADVETLTPPVAPECLEFAHLGARGTNLRIK